MIIRQVKEGSNPTEQLSNLLDILHREGPKEGAVLEQLSYFKLFHPDVFNEFEEKIISALGLFYKIGTPTNLYSFLMQGFGHSHLEQYNAVLTPVQASIRRAIDNNQFISISAPTSAGKSYSIRDFIADGTGDAVVVVPSRALIAEYMNTMRRKFENNKNVMITSFVDLIYTSRDLRRIFVLTPERSKDLYKIKSRLNVETFFFDEAQISEEDNRGMIFDVTVRRVKKHFPNAKLIFAHPFIDNPEAQFSKHGIPADSAYGHSYLQGAVGKICVCRNPNGRNYYFSPYGEGSHLISNCIEFAGSFRDFALSGEHSILVYVSKNSIYNGKFKEGFEDYIASLRQVTDPEAVEIIDTISHIVGADKPEHRSSMVELLRKGVVIHHGSIPLEVRFLIEDFIRTGHSKLCFATSTLAQGVNMPFDIVWLENNRFEGDEHDRALAFKNLIGRAGRLTPLKQYDYGYVYTTSAKLFTSRIQTPFSLKQESIIENPPVGEHENDRRELIEAIQNDTFDDDKNIPQSKVQRLTEEPVLRASGQFLDIIYRIPNNIQASIGGITNRPFRDRAKSLLKIIYEASLGREMTDGEINVFNNAIDILFHAAQGRSFSEIVGIKYNYISNRDGIGSEPGTANFSQPAKQLPNSALNVFSIYPGGTPREQVSYDAVMYDTYDYMDQVISFSLSDTLIAAFEIYDEQNGDERAQKIVELFRYGTNNKQYIFLLRYGFPPDMVKEIAPHVQFVDEERVEFSDSIRETSRIAQDFIEWYLPGS